MDSVEERRNSPYGLNYERKSDVIEAAFVVNAVRRVLGWKGERW
jgi:hypothetical protein